jgi:hypothetical protein
MTGSQQQYTAEHWLECAREVQERARGLKVPEFRHEMEAIARGYERLARYAERRMSRQPGSGEQISALKMNLPQGPEADPIAE